MAFIHSFANEAEDLFSTRFLKDGYLIQPVDHRDTLDAIRHEVVRFSCEELKLDLPNDESHFLNTIHQRISLAQLNPLRLALYNKLNSFAWFRPSYFALAQTALEALVGNELAMQNKINLSIQLPNDESSLLGVHADAWSGETPFQVVVWLPLVDVYDTKSMYILSPELNRTVNSRMKALCEKGGSAALFAEYEKDLNWLEVPYGSALVFSPNLIHGNVVNRTPETRWSFNTRFTGLFTPYTSEEKGLGNFYLPITTKLVSRIGMSYRQPVGFEK